MARIDPVIDRIFQESAAALVFETGTAAFLLTASGNRPVYKQQLSTAQILGAFAEITPAELQGRLGNEPRMQFPYVAPGGAVEITVEARDGNIRVLVKPQPTAGTPSRGGVPYHAVVAAKPEHVAPKPQPPKAPEPVVQVTAPAGAVPVMLSGDPRKAMEQLLSLMLEKKASDLHLTSGCVPMLRVDGDIVPVNLYGTLPNERLQAILWSIAPQRNQEEWEEKKDTDFAYETEESRFRVNVFCDRSGVGAVLRTIPTKIMSAEDMGLSKAILDLCFLHKGLVLVTGPTGSGKSTTLAAMVDYINRNRSDHIITIEDPIEFVHPNKNCLVNQREVSVHTASFKNALRAALREDPDIILVGELRDLETIAIAIETAETGHLVFGTLHTNTAPATIDRIIDQFPPDRQEQIRMMLSESLKGVIAQTLCKKKGGGRAAAQEVLICNSAVSNLIREGKTFQVPSIMQTGRNQGMVTLNDALLELVKKEIVAPEEALKKAVAKGEFKGMLERLGHKLEAPEN
ncbi:type IV pilus twitching motility protein PilT [Vulgatibacter sp.]|uniref:type IV pilus twitching motility protein PilT n=1 Tax=Vulgatibacter sp. TaxID=1971226 RepID=UPI00356A4EA6